MQAHSLEKTAAFRIGEGSLKSSLPRHPGRDATAAARPITRGESFRTWCRVAALSFGGPAGQIAVMHRIIVDERRWISEEQFLHALNYCMLLPGPEAQQLAIYIGWLTHRTWGGIMAGVLFVLPGFISILTLSILYVTFQQSDWLQGVFLGLKPAVLAIVLEAVIRIGRRVLKNRLSLILAFSAFVAIMVFAIPFPLLIAAAGLVGFIHGGMRKRPSEGVSNGSESSDLNQEQTDQIVDQMRSAPSLRRSLVISAVCLSLWFGPLVLIRCLFGAENVFLQLGTFFSQAAMVTFGGAYSVLVYIGQQAVETYGWLQPGEMLDGLGMAETTPGPLIMVVQFVGFMAAYRQPGPFPPLLAGVLASLLTTWVTFVPCFYWIFLGAPYVERLRGNRAVSAALAGITAAVVGVISYLAVWFSLHTLFKSIETHQVWGMRWLVPIPSTVELPALAIALVACWLTFRVRKGLGVTLAISVLLGIGAHFWRIAH